jgi:hypothetical protein
MLYIGRAVTVSNGWRVRSGRPWLNGQNSIDLCALRKRISRRLACRRCLSGRPGCQKCRLELRSNCTRNMNIFYRLALIGALFVFGTGAALPKGGDLAIGDRAPAFAYRELNGKVVRPADLRGHPYILWLVASWCSSCQTGSSVVADHIDMLKRRGVKVVELRLANDLGAPGPGLQAFQRAVGSKAFSQNWYWGEASLQQTLTLDPHGYPDIYYLVDAHGKIVAVSGNPAASWDRIEIFANRAR